MFIAALCTTAKTWNQPKCPSMIDWKKKMWYIYTMEYYAAIKKDETDLDEGSQGVNMPSPFSPLVNLLSIWQTNQRGREIMGVCLLEGSIEVSDEQIWVVKQTISRTIFRFYGHCGIIQLLKDV